MISFLFCFTPVEFAYLLSLSFSGGLGGILISALHAFWALGIPYALASSPFQVVLTLVLPAYPILGIDRGVLHFALVVVLRYASTLKHAFPPGSFSPGLR